MRRTGACRVGVGMMVLTTSDNAKEGSSLGRQVRTRPKPHAIPTDGSLTITITPEVLAIDSAITYRCAYFGIPSVVSGPVVVEALVDDGAV